MGMKAGGYVSESVETLSLLIRDAAPEVYLPALHALTLVINSAGLQVANSGYGKGAIVLLLSRLMAEVRTHGFSLSLSSRRRCLVSASLTRER
jgi:hypothetical protein